MKHCVNLDECKIKNPGPFPMWNAPEKGYNGAFSWKPWRDVSLQGADSADALVIFSTNSRSRLLYYGMRVNGEIVQDISDVCSGNDDVTLDVDCAGLRMLDRENPHQRLRLERDPVGSCCYGNSGMCSMNTDDAEDVPCSETGQQFVENAAALESKEVSVCCEDIVGMCKGNTDSSTDFDCDAQGGVDIASIRETTGYSFSICCNLPQCRGNANALLDFDCDATHQVNRDSSESIAMISLQRSDSKDICCVLPKCRGNGNGLLDFDCSASNHVYREGAEGVSMRLADNSNTCCVCPTQTHMKPSPELAGQVAAVPGAFVPDPYDGGVCVSCPEGYGINYSRDDIPDMLTAVDCEPVLADPVVTQTSWQEEDGKITRTYALAVPLGFGRIIVVSEAEAPNPFVDMG
jgi:hypothetical protein